MDINYVYLKDATLKIDEIIAKDSTLPWINPTEKSIALNLKVFWVKVTIIHSETISQTVFLTDQWAQTNRIESYHVVENEIVGLDVDGDQIAISDRVYGHRYPTFEYQLYPGMNHIYLKYDFSGLPNVRLIGSQKEAFIENISDSNIIIGAVFGGLGIMVFYNLIFYVVLRAREYLYYSLYVSGFILFQGCFNGFFFSRWIDHSFVSDTATIFCALFTLIFIILFTIHFLSVDKYLPKTARFGRFFCSILIANYGIELWSHTWGTYILVASNFIVAIWIIYVSIALVIKDMLQAKIYLMAWTSFAVMDLCSMLYYVGATNRSFLAEWGMMLGSLVEASLISFGLATKVYDLKREKDTLKIHSEETDLKIQAAKQIQESFLEISPPPLITHELVYIPAESMAGDWVLLEYIPNLNRAYLIVSDVTGHGIGSAIITVASIGSVKASLDWIEDQQLNCEDSLKKIAISMNRTLFRTNKEHQQLMTASIVCIDFNQRKGYYTNCGHLPSYLYSNRDQCVKSLFERGSILGINENIKLKVRSFPYQPGDQILMYTDGLLENGDKKEIRSKKLMQILAKSQDLKALKEDILQLYYASHPKQEDDVTVIAINYTA